MTEKYTPLDPHYEDRIRASFAPQGFMGLLEVHPGFCEIQVAYRRELAQQHGYFHAAVIGTLGDNDI